jgi:hypothetical protein
MQPKHRFEEEPFAQTSGVSFVGGQLTNAESIGNGNASFQEAYVTVGGTKYPLEDTNGNILYVYAQK